jgi:hypothetical protein
MAKKGEGGSRTTGGRFALLLLLRLQSNAKATVKVFENGRARSERQIDHGCLLPGMRVISSAVLLNASRTAERPM